MKQLLIQIEYIGTLYSGWQVQPNTVTIQKVIQDVFGQICQNDVAVNACSRTDAGVHAKGQVATLLVPEQLELSKLYRSANALLPRDIAVVRMVEVPVDFNIRKAAKSKRYVYQVLNSSIPRVFAADTWLLKKSKLDINKASQAIEYFKGTHDFSAFKGKGCQQPNPVKTITHVDVDVEKYDLYSKIRFTFEGSGFLKNMVRIMVGTLLDISQGRLTAASIGKALDSKKREDAGTTAPAMGLTLEKVTLDPNPFNTNLAIPKLSD